MGVTGAAVGDSPARLGAPIGDGILGESFQGIPLRGLATGGGVLARPAPSSWGCGGSTVLAVSSGNGSRGAGFAIGSGSGT
jgi:hypothetical protein